MENESKSKTPETDAVIIGGGHLYVSMCDPHVKADFARALECQRNEAREQARNADLRMNRAKRERDAAQALADSLRRAVRHCRLFIVEGKGYIADAALERESIKQEIDAILSENANVDAPAGQKTPTKP
jgi:DNA gyrase/topoisomerase IV subunit B